MRDATPDAFASMNARLTFGRERIRVAEHRKADAIDDAIALQIAEQDRERGSPDIVHIDRFDDRTAQQGAWRACGDRIKHKVAPVTVFPEPDHAKRFAVHD